MNKPIAITMGCPAGIGPEIIVKLYIENKNYLENPHTVVFGDFNIIKNASDILKSDIPLYNWQTGEELKPGAINILSLTNLKFDDLIIGKPSETTGRASYIYISEAIKYALREDARGIVTAPISKKGLNLAGINYPGHTEILSSLTGAEEYLMMLAGKTLKVSLVTIHIPLKKVADSVSPQNILKTILISHNALKIDFGIKNPRIAVCGLNPHSGESGMFGDEEEKIIIPAIYEAKKININATGPYPPDTIFYRASKGEFDLVVCMYHDQGLIPLKLLHFNDGVNITLGLPVVRTSVDHGTAYDIAGKGVASCESLREAVNTAEEIVKNRLNYFIKSKFS
jgi:4-hydroxythreonine-4-phosphate dehydrogenase